MSDDVHEGGRPIRPSGLLSRTVYIVVGTCFLLIFVIMIYATVARYFFSAPPSWGEEVPRLLFVWMVYLGAGLAIISGVNLRVTFFVDRLGPRAQARIEVVLHALVLVMLGVLAYFSIPVVELSSRNELQATGWNAALMKLPLPVGCVLIGWYELRLLLGALRSTRG